MGWRRCQIAPDGTLADDGKRLALQRFGSILKVWVTQGVQKEAKTGSGKACFFEVGKGPRIRFFYFGMFFGVMFGIFSKHSRAPVWDIFGGAFPGPIRVRPLLAPFWSHVGVIFGRMFE